MTLAFAPSIASIRFQLCLPIQKLRILPSVALLSEGTLPCSKNTLKYFSWFNKCINSFPVYNFDSTKFLSWFIHAKKESTNGFTVSFPCFYVPHMRAHLMSLLPYRYQLFISIHQMYVFLLIFPSYLLLNFISFTFIPINPQFQS